MKKIGIVRRWRGEKVLRGTEFPEHRFRRLASRWLMSEARMGGDAWRGLRAMPIRVADVITVVDEADEICQQSAAVTGLLGYGPRELLGCNVFEFVHPGDLPAVVRAYLDIFQNNAPQAFVEFRHRMRDGSWRPVEATITPSPSGAAGMILAFRDPLHGRRAREAVVSLQALFGRPEDPRHRSAAPPGGPNFPVG